MPELNLPTDFSQCSGCEACAAICPAHCIKMVRQDGFLYPDINESQCLHCNRCRQVCPQNTPQPPQEKHSRNIYGGYAKDDKLLFKASSGGIFPLLCQEVIARGGLVYGAALDSTRHILQHSRFTTLEECQAAFGSKYLQSHMDNSYAQVQADLKAGKWVLFSGTPCQVAGLQSFLGKAPRDKLLAVDVICHGASSPLIWDEYLDLVEKELHGKCSAANFREKSNGWEKFSLFLAFENGQMLRESHKENRYMQLFLKNLCLRESCHNCHFRSMVHPADITLGDFWGVRKKYPEKYNPQGTSIIISHTPQGDAFLDSLGTELVRWEADWEFCAQKNTALLHSPKRPLAAEAFRKDWKECGLGAILAWYGRKLSWREKALCLFDCCKVLRRKAISHFSSPPCP